MFMNVKKIHNHIVTGAENIQIWKKYLAKINNHFLMNYHIQLNIVLQNIYFLKLNLALIFIISNFMYMATPKFF